MKGVSNRRRADYKARAEARNRRQKARAHQIKCLVAWQSQMNRVRARRRLRVARDKMSRQSDQSRSRARAALDLQARRMSRARGRALLSRRRAKYAADHHRERAR